MRERRCNLHRGEEEGWCPLGILALAGARPAMGVGGKWSSVGRRQWRPVERGFKERLGRFGGERLEAVGLRRDAGALVPPPGVTDSVGGRVKQKERGRKGCGLHAAEGKGARGEKGGRALPLGGTRAGGGARRRRRRRDGTERERERTACVVLLLS